MTNMYIITEKMLNARTWSTVICLDNAAALEAARSGAGDAGCLRTAGNPGRGAHAPTLHASRIVWAETQRLARLFHAEASDTSIAFCIQCDFRR